MSAIPEEWAAGRLRHRQDIIVTNYAVNDYGDRGRMLFAKARYDEVAHMLVLLCGEDSIPFQQAVLAYLKPNQQTEV